MKNKVKVLILVLSIIAAVSGVMIYAKTIVEPPMALKQINQYTTDLSICYSSLVKAGSEVREDSIFDITVDRIKKFEAEGKLTAVDAKSNIECLLGKYTPLFFKHSFGKFQQNTWHDSDHNYMLSVVKSLKSMKHTDNTLAIAKTTLDSLNQVERVISNYRQARTLSRRTSFTDVASAQNVINQANKFVNDPWLSKCTELSNALKNIKPSIAQSHYSYVLDQVEKLSQYKYYGQSYYENTLIPLVDATVTEYDNKAATLYGSKHDVNSLWNKARAYYNEAASYYAQSN